MAATTFTVKLTRGANQPWGFRLQGGKDFSTPLSIQKVTNDSLAERAGLQAGDAILKINEISMENLRHKDAQDVVVRAGNHFELTVQRGAVKVWKPAVTPLADLKTGPKQQISNEPRLVTKTSLAANNQEVQPIGSTHNVRAKPFGGSHINGDTVTALVHKQYNSPAGLYSMQNIADTLTKQAEVLSTGAVGINFQKYEQDFQSKSDVFKMLQNEGPSDDLQETKTTVGKLTPIPQLLKLHQLETELHLKSQIHTAAAQKNRQDELKTTKCETKQLQQGDNKSLGETKLKLQCVEQLFNFMKSNPPVNKDSAVYRMVCEEAETPGTEILEPEEQFRGSSSAQDVQSRSFKVLQMAVDDGEADVSSQRMAALRHVEAPKLIPPSEQAAEAPKSGAADNLCAECGRLIVGVFVRIKDKSLHADCFKCTTCGSSLRNVGYYNINAKLYCDVHARQVSRQQAHPNTLIPLTVPPGAPLPKEAIVGYASSNSTFNQVGHSGAISPVNQPTSNYGTPTAVGQAPFQEPKPFATTPISVAVDTSAFRHPQTAPHADTHKQPVTGGSKFVWPPQKHSELPTEAVIEASLSPTIPTYRAPPTTQHVQFTSGILKHNQQSTTIATPSPKASPSYSPIFPAKGALPATPHVVGGPTPFSPSIVGPKPFSPLNISAKHVAAPLSPASSGTSAWVPTSPIGATTKPIPTAPTAGSRPAPRRGRGILNPSVAPGTRIPICAVCGTPIRGPFVTALGKTWCAEHFQCVNSQCRRHLQDIGFVEEQGQLYCEKCYETYLAPVCSKCNSRIKGDCLNAIGKQWHPECFVCANCRQPFGNSHFYLEDGLPYCEKDWNEQFTTKCLGCGFPIEAGDRWVEALNSNYHSQCFKCTICHKNLEGQSFYAKGGRPFCKAHAR